MAKALGAEELKGAKEKLGISLEPFSVPGEILKSWREPAAAAQQRARTGKRKWRHCPAASALNSTAA